MANAGAETSRIRDGVRDSKIRLDIPLNVDLKFDSFVIEPNRYSDWRRHDSYSDTQLVDGVFPHDAKAEVDGGCYHRRGTTRERNINRFRKILPTYMGSPFIEDIWDWSDAIEDYFEEMKPPERLRCKIAAYTLDGAAEQWWQQLQHRRFLKGKLKISSWLTMKYFILNDFWPTMRSTKFSSRGNRNEHNLSSVCKVTDETYNCPLYTPPVKCSRKCSTEVYNNSKYYGHCISESLLQQIEEGNEGVKHGIIDTSLPVKCSTEFPSQSNKQGKDEVVNVESSTPTKCPIKYHVEVNIHKHEIEVLKKQVEGIKGVVGFVEGHERDDDKILDDEKESNNESSKVNEPESIKVPYEASQFPVSAKSMKETAPTTVTRKHDDNTLELLAIIESDSYQQESGNKTEEAYSKYIGEEILKSYQCLINHPVTRPIGHVALYEDQHEVKEAELLNGPAMDTCLYRDHCNTSICQTYGEYMTTNYSISELASFSFDPGGRELKVECPVLSIIHEPIKDIWTYQPGSDNLYSNIVALKCEFPPPLDSFDGHDSLRAMSLISGGVGLGKDLKLFDLLLNDLFYVVKIGDRKTYGYSFTDSHFNRNLLEIVWELRDRGPQTFGISQDLNEYDIRMLGGILIVNFDPGGMWRIDPNASNAKRQSVVVNQEDPSPVSKYISIIDFWENIFAHNVTTPATLKDKGYDIDDRMTHLAEEGELLASNVGDILHHTNANVLLMSNAPPPLSNLDLPEIILAIKSLYAPALQSLNLGPFINVILSFDPGGITYSSTTWNSVSCFRSNTLILFASDMMSGLNISSPCDEWKIEPNVIDRREQSEFMFSYLVVEIQANAWKTVVGCVLLFDPDGGTYCLKSWSRWMCFLSMSYRFFSINIAAVRNCWAKLHIFQFLHTYLAQDGVESFSQHGSKGADCQGKRIAIVQYLNSVWHVCFVLIHHIVYVTVVNRHQLWKNNTNSEVSLRTCQTMHIVFYGLGLSVVKLLSFFLPLPFIYGLLLMHGTRKIASGSKSNKEGTVIWQGSSSCDEYTDNIFELRVGNNEGCVKSLLDLSIFFVISAFRELELLFSRQLWGNLETNIRFNLTRGRVIPSEGNNDENNFNYKGKFITGEMNVAIIDACGNSLYKSGQSRECLKLFHKVVNGLDPPMDLDDINVTVLGRHQRESFRVRSWTSFLRRGMEMM